MNTNYNIEEMSAFLFLKGEKILLKNTIWNLQFP